MLGLKLPTDPRWADIASKNMGEILTDHAYCEQKAASSAISFIVRYPERTELVMAMTELCREEMSHFSMVMERIVERGLALGKQRQDLYVHRISSFFARGGSKDTRLVNELLVAALIEARSCERFRVLSENLSDAKLALFYRDLMVSEANHYTMFLRFAREFGNVEEVNRKWQALLEFEAEVMADLGRSEHIHG